MLAKVARTLVSALGVCAALVLTATVAHANEAEALKALPDLGSDAVKFFGVLTGKQLLMIGLGICVAGGACP